MQNFLLWYKNVSIFSYTLTHQSSSLYVTGSGNAAPTASLLQLNKAPSSAGVTGHFWNSFCLLLKCPTPLWLDRGAQDKGRRIKGEGRRKKKQRAKQHTASEACRLLLPLRALITACSPCLWHLVLALFIMISLSRCSSLSLQCLSQRAAVFSAAEGRSIAMTASTDWKRKKTVFLSCCGHLLDNSRGRTGA